MILNQDKRQVEIDSQHRDSNQHFSIQQTSKMFDILSSNIYSDKILAVVREYGTNALDAHIAVGKKDIPFEVHLPNSFEPWFSIRDFGPGLSHEDVMGLYSRYGFSTKDQSNEMVGCLGLGSKSGFAYTDQFTITSRNNKERRTYSAYVDPNGIPAITLLSRDPLEETEQEGLEIYIPVKSGDYSAFADRAKTIYRRFPTLPKILGNVIDLSPPKYSLSRPTYRLREDGRGGCVAIQGALAYPIDSASFSFPPDWPEGKARRLSQILAYCPLDIEFPLGALNITASRERLNYDRGTQQNIIQVLEQTLLDIPSQFQNTLAAAPTLWEAKVLWKQWQDSVGSGLREALNEQLQWKGQTIKSNKVDAPLYDEIPVLDPLTNKPQLDLQGNPVTKAENFGCFYEYTTSCLRHNRSIPTSGRHIHLWASPDTTFVYEDKPLRARNQVIRHNFQEGPVLLISGVPQDRIQEVWDSLGNPPKTILASSLTTPPALTNKKQRTKTPSLGGGGKAYAPDIRPLAAISRWEAYHGGGESVLQTPTPVDVTLGGIYALTYKGKLVPPKSLTPSLPPGGGNGDSFSSQVLTYSPAAARAMQALAGECADHILNLGGQKVYALSYSEKDRVLKAPTQAGSPWRSIWDVAGERLQYLLSQKDFRTSLAGHIALDSFRPEWKTFFKQLTLEGLTLSRRGEARSPFGKIVLQKGWNQATEDSLAGSYSGIAPLAQKWESLKTVFPFLETNAALNISLQKWDTHVKKTIPSVLAEHYPLIPRILTYARYSTYDSAERYLKARDIIDYINTCDHSSYSTQKKGLPNAQ